MTTYESPPSPATLLLVSWESYITPSQAECTQTPPQTGEISYDLIEKCLKLHLFE